MIKKIWKQFTSSQFYKNKLVLTALLILLFFYIAIIFAEFLTPYSKNYSDRQMSYAPPSKIYIINEKGKLSLPYTYNYERYFDENTFKISFKEDKSQKYFIKLFNKGEQYNFLGLFPTSRHLFGVEEEGRLFLLGTDINGRDVFSRLFFGARISLTVGFIALFIAFPIGLLYGSISGYLGGKIDNIMMRIAEAILSIPTFYLLVILAGILPANMTSVQRFMLITVILSFIGWAGFSRVIRGMVLSIKNADFVVAAKTIGQRKSKIILKHIIPQTMSYAIVAMTLSVPSYILAESGLSFLGLGIQQPDASWGNMLKEAQALTTIIDKPLLLMPGILIFVAVLAFNTIGDTIRDILDPKYKRL